MHLISIIPAALTFALTYASAIAANIPRSLTPEPATTAERAIEKRNSPALIGYNADPNIAVFGDTYYIYPTTDGFPSWGGQTFYWWKSVRVAPQSLAL
ncbi:hypothetical protein RRF57_001185 [Xylaria bambusicola]|uniref:Uncharacterized protein n=1 Tax=Xylaria bambusicola TaxID=326684 RepID=A0AAN7UG65_9PEZI